MDLKGIMLGKKSKYQKITYGMIPFIYYFLNYGEQSNGCQELGSSDLAVAIKKWHQASL